MSVPQGSFDGMGEVRFSKPVEAKSADSFALSPSQTEVASLSINAVAAVFGAPGSGKTTSVQALFLAAAKRAQPSEVLVLTSNRESANQLRDQLALAYQGATAGPLARSLSSFAFGVLRLKALAESQKLPELISGSEQDRILAQVIGDFFEGGLPQDWPKQLGLQVVSLNGFRAELRDLITVCIEHDLDAEALMNLGLEHQKVEWQAAAKIYQNYLNVVAGVDFEGRFDPSSLLVRASQWLESLSAWPHEVDSIKQIIVDDAQDLTPAAIRLLRVLAGANRGLVLVGDPDASTLGFRAADPRAMANLADSVSVARRSKTETIFLAPTHEVRPAQLAAVMSRVNRQIDTARAGRQRKSLVSGAAAAASDALEVKVFNHETSEIAWLARRLRELHLFEGLAWSDMAVVCRSRNSLDALAVALANESVPVTISGAQTPLRDAFASKHLLQLAHTVLNPVDVTPTLAVELLTSPLAGLDSLDLRRLRRSIRREELLADGTRNSDELLVALFDAEASLTSIKGSEARKAERFIQIFSEAKQLAAQSGNSIEDLLWHLWSKSGLEKAWQTLSRSVGEVALQANRDLDAVVALFAAANRFAERYPDGDARVFVDQQLALGLPEDTLASNSARGAQVTLTTPSNLTAKRFRVVALPQLIEGAWPNLRPRSSLLGASVLDAICSARIETVTGAMRSELPDELRMLYKAIGSTTEKLLVSTSDSEDNQISQFIGLINESVPQVESFSASQLTLRGLSGSLRRRLARAGSQGEVDSLALGLARLASAAVAGAHPDSWYGRLPLSTNEALVDLDDPEAQVWLRPSQLENFAKCPLHWFLNANGGSDSTFEANLGSLVHKALELAVDVQEDTLWGLVESKWHTISFESAWLEQAAKRRAKKLVSNMVQYLRKFEAEGGQVLGREVNFQFELGQATISGQVDRVELYPDGRVMIVDLKTGSRGFTNDEAKHHAQLGLYQLAYQAGVFDELSQGADAATQLAGAKLLLVGTADKFVEREQPSLDQDLAQKLEFQNLIASATKGMAMSDRLFIAQVDSHCRNTNEYGSCDIHLTKAVSYGG